MHSNAQTGHQAASSIQCGIGFYLPSRWTVQGVAPACIEPVAGESLTAFYLHRPTISCAVQVWTPPAGHGLTGHAPDSIVSALASDIRTKLDITRAWNALDQGLNNLSTTLRFSRVLGVQGVMQGSGISLHIDALTSFVMGSTRR